MKPESKGLKPPVDGYRRFKELSPPAPHPQRRYMENEVPDAPAHQIPTGTSGPLTGLRIVEFAGIGPGPFASMMLADMGAEVITLDRLGADKNQKSATGRGRKIVELDLKNTAALAQTLDLLEHADALIEGFRPGVMERLGLAPSSVVSRHPPC